MDDQQLDHLFQDHLTEYSDPGSADAGWAGMKAKMAVTTAAPVAKVIALQQWLYAAAAAVVVLGGINIWLWSERGEQSPGITDQGTEIKVQGAGIKVQGSSNSADLYSAHDSVLGNEDQGSETQIADRPLAAQEKREGEGRWGMNQETGIKVQGSTSSAELFSANHPAQGISSGSPLGGDQSSMVALETSEQARSLAEAAIKRVPPIADLAAAWEREGPADQIFQSPPSDSEENALPGGPISVCMLPGQGSWQVSAGGQSSRNKLPGAAYSYAHQFNGQINREMFEGMWIGGSVGTGFHQYELRGPIMQDERFLRRFPRLRENAPFEKVKEVAMRGQTVQMGLHLQKRFRTDAKVQPYAEIALLAQRWVDQDFEYTYQGENGPYKRSARDQQTKQMAASGQFEAGIMLASYSGWGVQLGMNHTLDWEYQGVEEFKRSQTGVRVGVFYAFGG